MHTLRNTIPRRPPARIPIACFAAALSLLVAAGCADDGARSAPQDGTVEIAVEKSAPRELNTSPASVTSVTLSIFNEVTSAYIVTNSPLTNVPPWSGTFTGLPRHASLTYEAEGLVGTSAEFTGSTTAAVSTATGAVQVVLRPYTGNTFTMPKVSAITNPSPVNRGSTANYTFAIQGEPNETVTWTVAAVTGNANQWPATKTGTVPLDASGVGSLVLGFTGRVTGPPSSIACNTHNLDILDTEGVTFRALFTSLSCDTGTNPTCTPIPSPCS